MKKVNKIWELLERSIIVQALVTGALVLSYCYLTVQGLAVPDAFQDVMLVVVGFWFGSQSTKTAYRNLVK